jgi:hypothetical protein
MGHQVSLLYQLEYFARQSAAERSKTFVDNIIERYDRGEFEVQV